MVTPLTLGSFARKGWGWRDREVGNTLEVSSTSVRCTALTTVVQGRGFYPENWRLTGKLLFHARPLSAKSVQPSNTAASTLLQSSRLAMQQTEHTWMHTHKHEHACTHSSRSKKSALLCRLQAGDSHRTTCRQISPSFHLFHDDLWFPSQRPCSWQLCQHNFSTLVQLTGIGTDILSGSVQQVKHIYEKKLDEEFHTTTGFFKLILPTLACVQRSWPRR